MGDKKQKEAMIKKVKQVLVVGACVLFVVLMVLSGMGTGWLSMFTVIKTGDTAVVDYTIYDSGGNPLLTSNQQVYTKAAEEGRSVVIARQLSMVTGQNLTSTIYPVMIYTQNNGWSKDYALFSTEYNAINGQLVGMKAGDQKSIQIPDNSITQEWSATQLANNSVNITDLRVGDFFALGVSDDPEAMVTNGSVTYTRVGYVAVINNESIIVELGYPRADISIVAINPDA